MEPLKEMLTIAGGVLLAMGSLVVLSGYGGGGSLAPSLPPDYRSWTHTKTALRLDPTKANSGLHHIYANPQALQALKAGGQYQDGSILVFDLYEAKLEGDKETGTYIAGKRKFRAVMEKDSRQYPETGGWGFVAYKGDTLEPVTMNPKADCFEACHASIKQKDFVFSEYVE